VHQLLEVDLRDGSARAPFRRDALTLPERLLEKYKAYSAK